MAESAQKKNTGAADAGSAPQKRPRKPRQKKAPDTGDQKPPASGGASRPPSDAGSASSAKPAKRQIAPKHHPDDALITLDEQKTLCFNKKLALSAVRRAHSDCIGLMDVTKKNKKILLSADEKGQYEVETGHKYEVLTMQSASALTSDAPASAPAAKRARKVAAPASASKAPDSRSPSPTPSYASGSSRGSRRSRSTGSSRSSSGRRSGSTRSRSPTPSSAASRGSRRRYSDAESLTSLTDADN